MSKIGVQSQSGILPDLSKVLAKTPLAYKLLGNAVNLGIAQTIRAQSPGTLIIIRAQPDNWQLDANWTNGFIERALATAEPFLKAGVCDLLEPPNEPIIHNDSDARTLNDLQISVAERYQSNGFQCLAYQFSVGNPDYPLWQYLDGGLLACNGWLGLHEYGAPTLQANAADLSLRHRKVYPLLSASARALCKIVVSECGLDFGIGRAAPDGMPTAGGYRAMPAQGDDELYWIKNYTTQLAWWDAELAKDTYIKAATLYGYGMNGDWRTFDVAAVDTDRAYFINWLQAGGAPIPPPNPEPEPTVPITPAETIATVPFLVKRAIQLELGPSIYGEYDPKAANGDLYHAWLWQRGGVVVKDGDYDSLENAKLFNPQTGEPMAQPLPWPGGGSTPTNPQNCPAVIAANGAVCELSNPPRQFVLAGASVKQGVSAFCVVTVIGKNGVPVVGARVVNIWKDSTNGEMVLTDGSGAARFQFGPSSASSVAGQGPFTFAVSLDGFKDTEAQPPVLHQGTLISDLVHSVSDWQAQHTEWSIQFVAVG